MRVVNLKSIRLVLTCIGCIFLIYCICYIHWRQNEVQIVTPNFPTKPITDFLYEEDDSIDYEDITIFSEFVENEVSIISDFLKIFY